LAQELGIYNTVGIDLVAMSVNDLIVCGAEPLQFLDYIALGGLDESILHPLIKGIVAGCEEAECRLAGGETAEMPDLYAPGDFDLAGFAVGIAEKSRMLPKKDAIRPGAVLIALPSSGVHSNGLSLARKAIPAGATDLRQELLTPTRIYVPILKRVFAETSILAAAHITGGGLEGNISRVLPDGCALQIEKTWQVPAIFEVIQQQGGIESEEMYRVFNMGVGMVLVTEEDRADDLLNLLQEAGEKAFPIGRVIEA
jgi:phosphoribosylformylglycinamidine cyclo-ligase